MKKMKKCCRENKPKGYNPRHIYMCKDCQMVYPPVKKGN
jgi:hypothetical protein